MKLPEGFDWVLIDPSNPDHMEPCPVCGRTMGVCEECYAIIYQGNLFDEDRAVREAGD